MAAGMDKNDTNTDSDANILSRAFLNFPINRMQNNNSSKIRAPFHESEEAVLGLVAF
jgi:hypothetical protein